MSKEPIPRWTETYAREVLQRAKKRGAELVGVEVSQEEALVLFLNRRKDRLKMLWCDPSGWCLLHKQLERGIFRIPEPLHATDRGVEIDARELVRILEGVALPSGTLAPPTRGLNEITTGQFPGLGSFLSLAPDVWVRSDLALTRRADTPA